MANEDETEYKVAFVIGQFAGLAIVPKNDICHVYTVATGTGTTGTGTGIGTHPLQASDDETSEKHEQISILNMASSKNADQAEAINNPLLKWVDAVLSR